MDLRAWQTRLHQHFAGLQRDRAIAAPGQPIFGLEHDLSIEERQDLSAGIRAHIRFSQPLRDNILTWIVYASEFGYSYAGDEYWQSFEAKTPGWREFGNRGRDWIRQCFIHFHETYNGAMPTGPWAWHFSIICWPITHALLPCDLQRELAQLLYDLRHLFTPDVISSPTKFGELIGGRSWSTSSRFQQLTQEPRFLGQIAGALLLHGSGHSPSIIYPSTLQRIQIDLDQERHSRVWLQSARESATSQISFASKAGRRAQQSADRISAALAACL